MITFGGANLASAEMGVAQGAWTRLNITIASRGWIVTFRICAIFICFNFRHERSALEALGVLDV